MSIEESNYALWSPISTLSTCIDWSKKIGLINTDETEQNVSASIVKAACRGIGAMVALPTLTSYTVFYNTASLSIKGSLAVISKLTNSNVFSHSHEEYINDVNMHIAYAVKDITASFFSGSVSLGYIFCPDIVKSVDQLSEQLLRSIVLDKPVENIPPESSS